LASLSLSRAWDETRGVLRRDGRLITAVALAMLVLPGVIADVVTPQHPGTQMAPFGYWTIVSFLSLLVSLAGQLAIVRLALGPPSSVGEAIRHGARRLPAYVGATLMWMLPLLLLFAVVLSSSANPEKPTPGVAFAVLLLCGLFFFVFVRLLLAPAVASAEAVSSITVLRRSWGLSRGRFGRLFAFLILFLITYLILMVAFSAVIGSAVRVTLGDVEPFSVAVLLMSFVTQLVGALLTSSLMVMVARLYAQLSGRESSATGLPRVHPDETV
jgi:hypothetical protein